MSTFNPAALEPLARKLDLPTLIRWLLLRARNTVGIAKMLPLVTEAVIMVEEDWIVIREGHYYNWL